MGHEPGTRRGELLDVVLVALLRLDADQQSGAGAAGRVRLKEGATERVRNGGGDHGTPHSEDRGGNALFLHAWSLPTISATEVRITSAPPTMIVVTSSDSTSQPRNTATMGFT